METTIVAIVSLLIGAGLAWKAAMHSFRVLRDSMNKALNILEGRCQDAESRYREKEEELKQARAARPSPH